LQHVLGVAGIARDSVRRSNTRRVSLENPLQFPIGAETAVVPALISSTRFLSSSMETPLFASSYKGGYEKEGVGVRLDLQPGRRTNPAGNCDWTTGANLPAGLFDAMTTCLSCVRPQRTGALRRAGRSGASIDAGCPILTARISSGG